MSGFLHQLAARSLGLAPQIKLRSALPYAAPAIDTLAFEADTFQPSPDAFAPASAVAPVAPASALTVPDAPADSLTADSPHPAPLLAERSTHNLVVDRPAKASFPAAATGDEPHQASLSQQPSLVDRKTNIKTGQRDTSLSLASPPAATIYRRAEPVSVPESQPGNDDPISRLADLESLVSRLFKQETNQPATPADNTPTPTTGIARLSTQRSNPISTLRPPASRESQQAAATESSPEVHITIGRLEVNPPARPAPPPPPRPRSPAPLSLSDYLARRHGGRS